MSTSSPTVASPIIDGAPTPKRARARKPASAPTPTPIKGAVVLKRAKALQRVVADKATPINTSTLGVIMADALAGGEAISAMLAECKALAAIDQASGAKTVGTLASMALLDPSDPDAAVEVSIADVIDVLLGPSRARGVRGATDAARRLHAKYALAVTRA